MNHPARLLLFFAVGLAAGTTNASGAEVCPSSTVALYDVSPVTKVAARVDSISGTRRAAYDLLAGTVEIVHPGGVGSMYCEPADRYRVTGLPDGTPVQLVARLAVNGYAETAGCGGTGCYGEFGARIGQGASVVSKSVTARFGPETVTLQETIDYPLDVLAGEWFDLQFRLWFLRAPGASHYGGGSAQLTFGALPEGADVVSCQGYQLTVPTRPKSWGQLKQLYR